MNFRNRIRSRRDAALALQPPHRGQQRAGRDAEPVIEKANCLGAHVRVALIV